MLDALVSRISGYCVRRQYGRFRARVDPRSILYVRRSDEWPRYIRKWPFLLCPGRWDLDRRQCRPFREDQIRQLFVEGRHYTETDEYRRLLSELQRYGKTRFPACSSRREIRDYFDHVRRLYERMKAQDGVEAGACPGGRGGGITVRIGRDGALLKCRQGTHRLAIARVLGLPSVPVIVDLMHPGSLRHEFRENHLPGRRAIEAALRNLGARSTAVPGAPKPVSPDEGDATSVGRTRS